jgi:hypothetical protein
MRPISRAGVGGTVQAVYGGQLRLAVDGKYFGRA